MRAYVSGKYKHIISVMAAQSGKTQGAFNLIGHRFDDDPVPILYIGPTKSNISNVIEPKVDEMLRSTPDLWAKVSKGKKYTTFKKIISGVALRFAWAGSATEIAADSACIVIVDEIDRIVKSVKGEGNIIEIANARHSDYPDGLTVGMSTPTEGNIDTYIHPDTGVEHWKVVDPDQVPSPVWVLWQQGTRHEWAWPCPECDEYFIPRLKLLNWPKKCTPEVAEKEATLACPNCGALINTRHKSEMNARGVYLSPGQWVEDGEVCGEGIISNDFTVWVSGIASFSSKKTFGFLAEKWLRAARSKDPEKVKGVLNTQFGECFKFGGEAPEWKVVRLHKQEYKVDTVPNGVYILISTVDVQKDRLVYVVRGWGFGMESWQVDFGELWGSTDKRPVWDKLEDLLEKNFQGHFIRLMIIDSGYRADEVYHFCRRHISKAFPAKGHDTLSKPFYSSKIDVTYDGKVIKEGLQLWHFDSDIMKSWVHSRISLEEGEKSTWHLCSDITDDYCQQVVAEERATKPSGGVTWIKKGENHYLDCEGMQVLGAKIAGVERLPKQAVSQQTSAPGVARKRRVRSKGI